MARGLNARYRDAAEEFARRVRAALGEQVHSIVLFGSVARNRARRDSDIDVLVVYSDSGTKRAVTDAAYDCMESSGFESVISVIHVPGSELDRLKSVGSPFLANLINEGRILYDDGTFSEIREGAASGSK